MHLIRELGESYFRERFASCMFLDLDGNAAYLNENSDWYDNQVPCFTVTGPASKPVIAESRLPYDFFKDLSVFAVPPLGWRAAAQGRYLVHFSRNNRSYHRAIAPHILRRVVSPSTQYLLDTDSISSNYYERAAITVNLVMKPEYHTMQEGLALMRQGKLFSFCSSANVSVIPDTEGRQAIFFNTNRVGTVESNGTINCTVPVIQSLIEAQA